MSKKNDFSKIKNDYIKKNGINKKICNQLKKKNVISKKNDFSIKMNRKYVPNNRRSKKVFFIPM